MSWRLGGIDSISRDARDADFLRKFITEGAFDSVINCIGILNQFAEENKNITLQLAKTMGAAALKRASGLFNIVTDCAISK